MQQVRAQRRDAGTAAALPHEVERVQHKAGVHLVGQRAQVLRDFGGAHAAVTALRPLDAKQAHAGREHAAVHDVDTLQLRRRDTGVVAGGGQLRADVEMDDLKALLRQRREEIQKLLDARRGGLGQHAVRMVAGVDISGRKLYAVQIALAVEQDRQRDDPDVKAFQKLRREIAGAVGGNDDGF